MKVLATDVGILLNQSGVVVALASWAKSTEGSCDAASCTAGGAAEL